MPRTIQIHLDKILFGLLCGYAFFIPLEKLLQVFWGIDTVLKPYRAIALVILGVFAIKLVKQRARNPQGKRDLLLYALFGYGFFITLVRMISETFHMGYLLNDTFQIGLYLAVFVVMRHTQLSVRKMHTLAKFLVAGIFCNAFYMFFNFIIMQTYRRTGGMMDNPNYLALSIVIGILYLLIYRQQFAGWRKRLAWLIGLLFLGYVLILAGSRTALGVLVVCLVLAFVITPLREKMRLVALSAAVAMGLTIGGLALLRETAPLMLVNRIQKKKSGEDNRMPLWQGAVRAAESTNFTGLGVGQFKGRFREFYIHENNDLIRRIVQRNYFLSPHSDYLAILVVYGAIGLLAYLSFLVASGSALVRKLRNSLAPEHKRHYRFAFLIFAAVAIFGITHESIGSAFFWMLLTYSTQTELIPSTA